MKNAKYKHVIWDWNGTLLDDSALCVEIVNEILSDHRLNGIEKQSYLEEFTFPARLYYKLLGLPWQGEVYEQLSHRFITSYHERWERCELQPEALATMSVLADGGVGQSLLSAGKQEHVKGFVEHHDLSVYFSQVSGTTNVYAEGKVERGRKHLDEIEADPNECMLVGDTLHDLEVARSIGVDCLLFAGGHHSERRLRETDAPVIRRLSEVWTRLID